MPSEDKRKDDRERKKVKLGWKDYVAFVIALFQTMLLPIILFMIVLIVIMAIFLILV